VYDFSRPAAIFHFFAAAAVMILSLSPSFLCGLHSTPSYLRGTGIGMLDIQ
jgi:hypothetical protein